MRSFARQPDKDAISAFVAQQFEVAADVLASGLVLIIEPEIDIYGTGKAEAEQLLETAMCHALTSLTERRSGHREGLATGRG
jgi:fructose-bisphosphate aldolase, class I